MRPILQEIRKEYPFVDTIEFFSDGPTSQYRQKGNFHLLILKAPEFGFKSAVWNFFEAGHDKGIPDAVGGAIKRNADRFVKFGGDITTSEQFVKAMNGSDIHTILVPSQDIVTEIYDITTTALMLVKGTLKLH